MIRCICSLLLILHVSAHAEKEVAITIDDLPFLSGRYVTENAEDDMFRKILDVLKKHDVMIIGFICGSRIKQHHMPLINEFISDGHTLGNHSFTHPDLNNTTIEWYKDDILKCDSSIANWIDSIRYFRYPYLHRGPNEVKYNVVTQFLEENSFTTVPVTIDNKEWLYNKEYTRALKERKQDIADSIGQSYLEHMQDATHYFDSLAVARHNRNIKHILILHMNELNSVYLDTLLTWYGDNGWSFITTEEALTDPIYREDDAYIGTSGESWLLRF